MNSSLPLNGDPAGPTVVDVALEPQTSDGVIVLATVTDPEGTDNMLDGHRTQGRVLARVIH